MRTYIFKTFIIVMCMALISCSPEDGKDGNANVIASDWITTQFATSSVTFTNFSITDNNINTKNVSEAAIVAHGKLANGDIVTIPYGRNSRFYYFTLSADTNEITFRAENLIGNQSTFNDLKEIRYTIIPTN